MVRVKLCADIELALRLPGTGISFMNLHSGAWVQFYLLVVRSLFILYTVRDLDSSVALSS